jgi:formylglycine-generating enzyme
MCALTLVGLTGDGEAAERALPPHAVGAVRSLLQLTTPLKGGSEAGVQLSATIERDRIAVVGRDSSGAVQLAVTLVHPDDAPPAATMLRGLALVREPGPAPEALLHVLVERIDSRQVTLPWVTIEREPSEEAEPDRGPRQDWSRIDRWLTDGALRQARAALTELTPPEEPMALAHFALRWRLAGDPARAGALVAGREAERSAHEVLALRIALGAALSDRVVLEALPQEGPCLATGLARLLRRGGDCEQASRVADEILRREPTCAAAAHEAVVCHASSGRLAVAEAVLERAFEASPTSLPLLQARGALLARAGDHASAWRVEVQIATRRLGERGVLGGVRLLLSWFAETLRARVLAFASTLSASVGSVSAVSSPEARWCPGVANVPCLRAVAGGTFSMGAQSTSGSQSNYDPESSADEAPVRRVTIASLYAMETEVDVRSFTACVRAGACRLQDVQTLGGYFNYGQPLRVDHPVNGVNWAGASGYCAWIGGRLPTEAEWEFLARGAEGRRFPWGDDVPNCEAAGSRFGHQGCPLDGTRPPGVLVAASASGLTAMGSGVWEWVADWYGPYAAGAVVDPSGPAEGTDRVQRGGGWTTEEALERRASYRASMPPEARASDVGFRCVRSGP